jgi:hypothetical protein
MFETVLRRVAFRGAVVADKKGAALLELERQGGGRRCEPKQGAGKNSLEASLQFIK